MTPAAPHEQRAIDAREYMRKVFREEGLDRDNENRNHLRPADVARGSLFRGTQNRKLTGVGSHEK